MGGVLFLENRASVRADNQRRRTTEVGFHLTYRVTHFVHIADVIAVSGTSSGPESRAAFGRPI